MREFDEQAANRAMAELAATTDAELIVAIRGAMKALSAAWADYWVSPEFPPRGSLIRPLADDMDRAVGATLTAIRALGADDDVRAVGRAVDPMLSVYWPIPRSDTERELAELLDHLRHEAKTRPRLVGDARMLKARRQAADPARAEE